MTTKKASAMVLVSLLPGVTYLSDIRIKPGINRLDTKQLETIKPHTTKSAILKIVSEDEAKSLLADRAVKPPPETKK